MYILTSAPGYYSSLALYLVRHSPMDNGDFGACPTVPVEAPLAPFLFLERVANLALSGLVWLDSVFNEHFTRCLVWDPTKREEKENATSTKQTGSIIVSWSKSTAFAQYTLHICRRAL